MKTHKTKIVYLFDEKFKRSNRRSRKREIFELFGRVYIADNFVRPELTLLSCVYVVLFLNETIEPSPRSSLFFGDQKIT